MTRRCADLDEFFDGELAADQADAFREHLAGCDRCQDVLHGRMQESIAARVALARTAPATVPPAAAPGVVPIARARPGCVRALAYAAPLLAAAAAVPLWLTHGGDPGFKVSLAIDRAELTKRGQAAHVGDTLRSTVQGDRHQAIWVYLDDRELFVRCPEDARCHSADGELALELSLTIRGRYAIVAVGSSEAIPVPGTTLDKTLAAARAIGLHTQVEYVDVD